MCWFLFLGIAVALYFLYLFVSQVLTIHELKACISYSFNFPLKNVANMAYLVAVFGPLFASGKHIFKWFGVIVAVLAIITWLFFSITFASVWCFFAAVVSSLFFVYLLRQQ